MRLHLRPRCAKDRTCWIVGDWLGDDVPDAVINGRRMARGTGTGGLILYDASGQERGGYIAFEEPNGNAVITLETRRASSGTRQALPVRLHWALAQGPPDNTPR